MSNEILYILLPDFAAHEVVYLAQAIASDEFALKETPKYVNKSVAPTMEPIRSIGGFRTLPDYSFDTMPDDYAASVLIGGFGWGKPVADKVVPKTATPMRRPSATGISSRLTALQPSNLPGNCCCCSKMTRRSV